MRSNLERGSLGGATLADSRNQYMIMWKSESVSDEVHKVAKRSKTKEIMRSSIDSPQIVSEG